jgi:cell division septum initiation protein DivIVA
MPKKKRADASGKQTSVKVGNISDISGNVNVAGGNITTHDTTTGLSAAEIKQLFDDLYARIETRLETSAADKEDLKAEVKEIQTTVTEAAQKNEKVDEGFLSRRFRNIGRMAPDVLDVVVATLGNPLAGLGVAVKKIAEKAKQETSTPK